MIGKILGNRYEIVEKIGGGGMALVYKAKCKLLNRYVAVKVLRPEFTNDKDLIDKFKRESQAAASLSHPNIVNIYDVGEENDVYYIVMEYVDGKTLKELIKEKGILSTEEILDYTIQIALALKHAHSNHVVHRDIKPHNILITKDNRAKVTDFGIALAATSSTITNAGSVIGSVHYFSPEQARGGYTSEKSDLYSLGIVMYEMSTGRVPFDGDVPITIALKHIQEKAELPSKYNPSIQKGLELIILRLMQKEQSSRYSNASELIEDLYKIKNNFDLDYMDNTLKIEDSPTQIIPIVTANEIKELTNSKEETKVNNREIENHHSGNRRKFIIGSAVVAALLAALLFTFGFFYLSDMFNVEDAEVPNFVGMNIVDAQKKAQEAGIKLNIDRTDSSAPKDEVINQLTSAGMKVRKGFVVKVVVSEGSKLVVVPDLVYENSINVETILKKEGLKPGNPTEKHSEFPIGTIIDQAPKAGIQVASGTAVDYVISKGPEVQTINMPSLVGKTLQEAESLISQYKLERGTITEGYSDVFVKGYVIEQNIPADTEVSQGSVVNLIVSKGSDVPEQMEDLDKGEDNNPNQEEPSTLGEASTRSIAITLTGYTGVVDLEIYNITDGNSKKVYSVKHNIDQDGNLIRAQLTDSGRQEYAIYVNGKQVETKLIDF